MIGCIAKAGGDAITVDPDEMEEVCWVSREGGAGAWAGGWAGGRGGQPARLAAWMLIAGAPSLCLPYSLGAAQCRSALLPAKASRPACSPLCTDVATAVRLAQAPDSPYLGGKGSEEGCKLGFFVPPPFAIAHHLLKVWVERGPWFRSHEAAGVAAAAAAAQSNL